MKVVAAKPGVVVVVIDNDQQVIEQLQVGIDPDYAKDTTAMCIELQNALSDFSR